MRKKILAVVAMAVITTLAFTGCGKSNNASKDSGKAEGASGAITVISREEGSGTRGAFTELMKIVDDKDQDITTQTAEITNSTSVMLSTVAQNQKAIGYVSLGSLSNSVKALKVDGNEATAENVKAGTYKVSRPFNICYKENKLTDLDKQFIEFIMSEEGQKLVDAEGYISVGAEGNKPYEGTDAKGKITLAGSTSVAPLMDKLKDAFNKKAPNVSIEIQESGSSAGIQSAIEGAVEIGMSSRELKDEEKTDLTVKQIAMDGIAVIVNNDNTLDNITSDQIKDIYTGKTTEWSDVK
ncbi:substrate-binding domain-containing protein [Eubacterium sp.]|uniref:substrate-binding domain-containing protein n=1 Tax=Eubacterium sp. TaxID=142586 RepID=UPI003995B280